jgi:hypothetical protein
MYPILQRERPRKVSQVRSNFLVVELDHDSGAMTGEIIAGHLAARQADQLELSTLVALLGEFDPESRDLLAAYLDRRHPRWREDAQGDAAAGSGPARSGKMTKEEAYQILGLEAGASAEEIGRAHRGLMKKLHPDQGALRTSPPASMRRRMCCFDAIDNSRTHYCTHHWRSCLLDYKTAPLLLLRLDVIDV